MSNLYKYIHNIEIPEEDIRSQRIIEYQRETIEKLITKTKLLQAEIDQLRKEQKKKKNE